MSGAPHTVIQADDLTGAADSAVAFAEADERTVVVPWSGAGGLSDRLDAIVERLAPRCLALDTASRDEDARESRRRAAGAARWAAARGVGSLYKKVDSVLRGHVGAELEGVLDGLGAHAPRVVVVAPAFPALGRTTIDGRQLVDGRAVAGDAEVVSGLGAGRSEVALISLGRLRGDPSALTDSLAGGPRVAIVDAELESDLDLLAAAVARLAQAPLLVGSGGLAAAVARLCARQRDAGRGLADPAVAPREPGPLTAPAPVGRDGAGAARPRLLVSVTRTEATLVQLRRLRELAPDVIEVGLSLDELRAATQLRRREVERAAERAGAGLTDGHDVLLGIASQADAGVNCARATSALINRSVADAAALVVAARAPATIVANGGDCALALCGSLRIDALVVERALAAGIVRSEAHRARAAPLALITKSGGFGGPDALTELLGGRGRVPAVRA